MPKAIDIYVDEKRQALMVNTAFANRELMPHVEPNVMQFGWDHPVKIWGQMQDTCPTMICSRVRLVTADDFPIMRVVEETDDLILRAMRESRAAEGIIEGAQEALAYVRGELELTSYNLEFPAGRRGKS